MKNDLNLVLSETETVESVFEKFNGTVTAVESENDCQLVKDYDNFINAPDFNLRIYAVRKLENENFWRVLNNKNDYKIVNMAKTHGKSSIYQIARGKSTIGFYLNNMLHDGQTTYFLWSYREKTYKMGVLSNKQTVDRLFLATKAYPEVKQFKNGKLNRWGQIIAKLEANGATTLNAYEVLEKKDSITFYTELKQHNVLSKADKQLLRLIHKKQGGQTFDCYIESLENELEEINDMLPDLDYLEAYDLQIRKEEIENQLLSFSEEDNSLNPESRVEDMFYY